MKKILTSVILVSLILLLLSGCTVTVQPHYETSDSTLAFVGANFVEYSGDKECVGIFFDYTNNLDDSSIPSSKFVMAVHQNEKLLDTLWVADEVNGAICASENAQIGTTRVVYLFFLNDTSPLSVEVSDGQKFTIEYEQIGAIVK